MISIIILNYNRVNDSIELIKSIFKQTYKNYEIVLVDNNSDDDSTKILKSKFKNINIISLKNNIGRAGHNLGVKKAKGEILLFLDADIVLPKTFLLKLSQKFKSKKVDATSFFMKDSTKKTYGWEPNYDPNNFESTFGGGMWAIRKSIFKKVGGFNKDFFIYVDEWDYLIRLWNKGFRVTYFKDLVGTHKESPYTYRSVMRGYHVIINHAQIYALYLPVKLWGKFLKHHLNQTSHVVLDNSVNRLGVIKGLLLALWYFLTALPKRNVPSDFALNKFIRFYFPIKGDLVVGKWGWK